MEVKKIIPPVLILVLFLGSWHVGALIYNMAFLLSHPMQYYRHLYKTLTLL